MTFKYLLYVYIFRWQYALNIHAIIEILKIHGKIGIKIRKITLL